MRPQNALFQLFDTHKNRLFLFLFFTAAVFLLYGKCLPYPFVAFEDDFLIYQNPNVKQFTFEAFKNIWTGGENFQSPLNRVYIPLPVTSFQIQHRLSGLNPLPYRFVNLCLHLLNVLLVYKILLTASGKKYPAVFCGLIFAVHPLNTEAVVWISARKNLLSAFFFLLAWLSYQRFINKPNRAGYIASCIFFLLSILSSASGLLFIPVMLLTDYLHGRRHQLKIYTEKIPFIVLGTAVLLISLWIFRMRGDAPQLSAGRIGFMLATPLFYLGHFVWPEHLSAFYPFPNPLQWDSTNQIILAAGFLFLIVWILAGIRRSCQYAFGIVFFFLTLSPYLFRHTFYSDGGFANDRYMYLPVIGILWSLCSVFGGTKSFVSKSVKRKWLIGLLAGAVILGLGTASWARAEVWKNSETLLLDIVKKYPNAANAHEILARMYQKQDQKIQSTHHYAAAFRANPTFWRLAKANEALCRNPEALNAYQEALRENPQASEFYEDFGLFYYHAGKVEEAKKIFELALEKDPQNAGLINKLASMAFIQKDIDFAAALWEKILILQPDFKEAYNNLGYVYETRGNTQDAMRMYERALSFDPENKKIKENIERLNASR